MYDDRGMSSGESSVQPDLSSVTGQPTDGTPPEPTYVQIGVGTDDGMSTPLPTHGRGTARSLATALGVLVVPLVALVAFCQPKAAQTPTVDPSNVYAAATEQRAFRVREPHGLTGWKPTVATFNPAVGGRFTARVSYSTPDGHYLQLVQSNAAADSLIASVIDRGEPLGVEQIAGDNWSRYTARDGQETAFVLIEPKVTVMVVGDASVETARSMIRSLR